MKTLKDVSLAGKRVLLRVDFNVPLDERGKVADRTRIEAALPTIQQLSRQGARVILVSHLGRPKGEKLAQYSLKPVAEVLEILLGQSIRFCDDCVGESVQKVAGELRDGEVALLENLRFYKEETENDPTFARKLAAAAEAYVNDAFGCAHRAHASTVGVTQFLSPCAAGLLVEKELNYLGDKISHPERPLSILLGGAKVSDKIGVIEALLDKADRMLIGGAMAYTFSAALGHGVGRSLVEPDKFDVARAAMAQAEQRGIQLLLPVDHIVSDSVDFAGRSVGTLRTVRENELRETDIAVDIGPQTVALYSQVLAASKTVFWNGPMGIFEIPDCAAGTLAIARAVAAAPATSLIGGGDSIKAVRESGYASSISFMSTGGGASLEYLEGKILPGIAALDD
ncbi:MAG: phosphoglycerate kinase [Puniceicoccales bacterium]|jgi:3-phosphoglycerate kinase|nr:phosphoglycerate kinase [Puniceicoccales bacterium]